MDRDGPRPIGLFTRPRRPLQSRPFVKRLIGTAPAAPETLRGGYRIGRPDYRKDGIRSMATLRSIASWQVWLIVVGLGCAKMPSPTESLLSTLGRHDTDRELADQYRLRFQTERDPAAIRWLLAHRIQTGMSVSAVNDILGEPGTRVFADRPFKTAGGHFRSDDVIYKWGPDRDGNAYYLGFRNGILVNFDPRSFDDAADSP